MASASLPELNRRLIAKRGELVDTAAALRGRINSRVRRLEPRQIIKRHPGATLVAAFVFSLAAGRLAGGVLRRFIH